MIMKDTATSNAKEMELKKMSVLNMIEQVVELSSDTESITIPTKAKRYVEELSHRLNLAPRQVLLLSVFVNQCDDHSIQLRDLARHFDVKPISILAATGDIDELVRRNAIIRRKDSDGDISYRVPQSTIKSLQQDTMPEPESMDNLSATDWISKVAQLLKLRKNEEIEDEELGAVLRELIEQNQQLSLAQKLKSQHLCYTDLLLFLVMSIAFIDDHDDRIGRGDIDDYFSRGRLSSHISDLENGTHNLQEAKLVEFSCSEGTVETDHWCLTEYSKKEVFAELNLKVTNNAVRSNLIRPEDIAPKKLYYNERVTRQVDQLRSLLDKERMQDVMQRLGANGLRRGFTCLFYGGSNAGRALRLLGWPD